MSHHLRKPPPDGFELIEDELDRFDVEMREAERDPHDGKRKVHVTHVKGESGFLGYFSWLMV